MSEQENRDTTPDKVFKNYNEGQDWQREEKRRDLDRIYSEVRQDALDAYGVSLPAFLGEKGVSREQFSTTEDTLLMMRVMTDPHPRIHELFPNLAKEVPTDFKEWENKMKELRASLPHEGLLLDIKRMQRKGK